MKNYISSTGKTKLYTYKINGNEVEVLDPEGNHAVKVLGNPNGEEWTDVEKNAWGKKEVSNYNSTIADKLYETKINELNDAYNSANQDRVSTTDGRVFTASKSVGNNPTVSLQNTLDLIKNGCEFAVFLRQPSITLSDADNNDVTYIFDYSTKGGNNPIYILPVIELAERIALYFEIKRVIRNNINAIKNANNFDLDVLQTVNPKQIFEAQVRAFLDIKFPQPDDLMGMPGTETPVEPPVEEQE